MWSTKKILLFGGLILCEAGCAVLGILLKKEELALFIAKKAKDLMM